MTTLAYISAASHSGSTLLAMLLGAHPEACTVGELKATALGDPGRYRCSCGALIAKCRFWVRVRQAMEERGHSFDPTRAGTNIHDTDDAYLRRLLRPLHRGRFLEGVRDTALALYPPWHKHLREIQQRNAALVASLHQLTGASVIVDSSKTGLRLKYLLRNRDLDVRVIRLIRDGRAVALTYMDPLAFADASDPSKRAGGSGGTRRAEQKSMADAAREWRRSNEEAEHIVTRLTPGSWTEVRYEHLCAAPVATLQHLCDSLGMDPQKATSDFRSAEHHVIGNGMRLDSSSSIALDERWRTHLTPRDLAVFDSVAGNLNRALGYA